MEDEDFSLIDYWKEVGNMGAGKDEKAIREAAKPVEVGVLESDGKVNVLNRAGVRSIPLGKMDE